MRGKKWHGCFSLIYEIQGKLIICLIKWAWVSNLILDMLSIYSLRRFLTCLAYSNYLRTTDFYANSLFSLCFLRIFHWFLQVSSVKLSTRMVLNFTTCFKLYTKKQEEQLCGVVYNTSKAYIVGDVLNLTIICGFWY